MSHGSSIPTIAQVQEHFIRGEFTPDEAQKLLVLVMQRDQGLDEAGALQAAVTQVQSWQGSGLFASDPTFVRGGGTGDTRTPVQTKVSEAAGLIDQKDAGSIRASVEEGLIPTVEGRLLELQRLSQTRGGRGNIFDAFLSGQEISPILRGLNELRFNPLSAQFALQDAVLGLNPSTGTNLEENFQQFLGAGSGGYPTRAGFETLFSALAPTLLQGNLSGTAFDDTPQGDAQQATFNRFINPEGSQGAGQATALAGNVQRALVASGLAPSLRRFAPGIVQQRNAQLLQQDPLQNPFLDFVRKRFG